MAEPGEGLTSSLRLETRRLRSELGELTRLSHSFGRTIARAFAAAVTGGRKLSDVLRGLVLSLSRQTLSAALRPLGTALGGQLSNLFSALVPATSASSTGGTSIKPFASGGIVHSPTLFPLRNGVGLMAERSAEAILPLTRGPDGRLGVQSEGRGTVNVTVNISTPDVAGFQRSQSQVSALLARAVERGHRNL